MNYKNIITADFVRKTFRTSTLTHIILPTDNELAQIFYDECLSPIMLEKEDYEKLLLGNIVELHEGEVAIMFE